VGSWRFIDVSNHLLLRRQGGRLPDHRGGDYDNLGNRCRPVSPSRAIQGVSITSLGSAAKAGDIKIIRSLVQNTCLQRDLSHSPGAVNATTSAGIYGFSNRLARQLDSGIASGATATTATAPLEPAQT